MACLEEVCTPYAFFEVIKACNRAIVTRLSLLPGLKVRCLLLDRTCLLWKDPTKYTHHAKPLAKRTGQLNRAWPPCLA